MVQTWQKAVETRGILPLSGLGEQQTVAISEDPVL